MNKRDIQELVNDNGSTWELLQSWLKGSSVNYEVLNASNEKSENTLYNLQLTTKSTLGTIAYRTGGILVDHGWLKILGSGNEKVFGDLLYWNGLNNVCDMRTISNSMIVAYDILGGFFAINGGAFQGDLGNVFYLPPDTLEWEDMTVGYTDFLIWIFEGNLEKFYEGLRWNDWINDLKVIPSDKGVSFYPALWSEEGDVFTSSKAYVNIKEIWKLNLDTIDRLK